MEPTSMEPSHKNVLLPVLGGTFFVVLVGFAVWWSGGLGSLLRGVGVQPAAVVASLSTADTFAVLAGSAITNTGTTNITGDVGVFPTVTETGFVSVTITGTNHNGDATTQSAKTDLVTAYDAVAAQTPTTLVSADLGGQTLTPGVYRDNGSPTSLAITGTLTLDGQGDPNAVFIFQSGSTLTTAAGSSITHINGAQACNVFWQVGSSATLGTNSTFRGTILALTSITLNTGASVDGRVLAQNGAVTLDANSIIKPTCSAPPAPATLHVIKTVLNLGVGTAVASDFSIHVKSATSTLDVPGSPLAGAGGLGTLYTLPVGATYNITETANALPYTQTFGGACAPSGSATLAAGDNICTVTNTYVAPAVPVAVAPAVPSSIPIPVPLIALVKIPSPLALPSGPGPVTYTYTAKNIGPVALSDVWVKDDKCASVVFVSGDTNNDSKLSTNESWIYHCTKTVSATETNTATAHGSASGQDAYATALATVVVGAPTPPPLINIIKVPSRLTPFPFGGGDVTYAYTVTNPGVVAMHDVIVTDDKCAPVVRGLGDTNNNNLLDTGEVWSYTCQSHLSVSTRNLATALGRANGFVALGYAFATVLVSDPPVAVVIPKLPSTGLPPQGEIHSQIWLDSVALPHHSLRLSIPAINVDTPLESVGLTPQGSMGTPTNPTSAAWFNLGPRPGEVGVAVVDGHFGWKDGIPAAFDNLHSVQKGDKLYVESPDGVVTTFVVRDIQTYTVGDDVSPIFVSTDNKAHLNLITCGGVWDAHNESYSDRLVVLADKE